MNKKFISIDEARAVYEKIAKEYISPKYDGESLISKLPEIDFTIIFGKRKRMDADRLTQELCKILQEQIN